MGRKDIAVSAIFTEDGRIMPKKILWDDGRKFEIDKVLDIRQAASLKAGGNGMRYTSRIQNQQRYLFRTDENVWFIELD